MAEFNLLALLEGDSWEEKADVITSRQASSRRWDDNQLCDNCRAGDVQNIILCRSQKQEHSLGPLLDIEQRRQYCWFCDSLMRLCEEAFPQDLLDALLMNGSDPFIILQQRNALGTALACETVDWPCAQVRNLIRGGDWPRETSGAANVLTHYRFELAASDPSVLLNVPLTRKLSYEQEDRYLNYDQIGLWLRTCLRKHSACQRLQSERTPPTEARDRLYLIDVHTRKVEVAKWNTAYVALSYTWGSSAVQQLSDYRSVLEQPEQSTYFPRVLPKSAPATIEDAIITVQRMGQQYLWTDLYCINQSDPVERHWQIQRMDIVYEGALATICAISSSSSTAGLPGVSRPWKPIHQISTNLESGYLQITGNLYTHKDISTSVWRTRAWTFQECKLAGRKLCFGDHGVFMWCGEELFHHAMVDPSSESHIAMNYDNPRNPEMYAAFEPLGVAKQRQGRLLPNFIDFSVYVKFVNDYCRRNLTLESDAENAILGLLSRLSTIYEVSFVFGLPTHQITRALIWSCGACLERPRRTDFPSWTWLGWNADPKRTARWGGQPEYEYWLEEWHGHELIEQDNRLVYKLRVFWLDPGHSGDDTQDIAIHVASAAEADPRGTEELELFGLMTNCQIQCLARDGEPLSGYTADGEPMDGWLARGDVWEILDRKGDPIPREVILATDDDQTENYTIEISPEISSKIDIAESSTDNLKLVLLQRWVEFNQETGEPEETYWGDRGWFLLVLVRENGKAERIALINMEYEHFEAMASKEEILILV